MRADPSDTLARFRALHESGTFVIPNPWDTGTARLFAHMGFEALATTSAGMTFSRGLPERKGALPLNAVLDHVAELVAATPLPVNADFESGYAETPEGVFENVGACVSLGVAGLSIEDATGDPSQPLYEQSIAVERMRAARAAIDASGTGVLLTGRAECFLVGHPDPLRESIRRLQAYAEAGADVLYAPGLKTREQIKAVIAAVAPRPVNVLMSSHTGLTVADLADLGVRRISVGSALNRVAWGAVIRAAGEIASEGRFGELGRAASFEILNGLFSEFQGE